MLKVYVAGSWKAKAAIRKQVEILLSLGCCYVTSVWHWEPSEGDKFSEEYAWQRGRLDRDGVLECEIIVIDTTEPSASGGYYTEFGMAIGTEKTLILIGPKRNLFFGLVPKNNCYDSWEDFFTKCFWTKEAYLGLQKECKEVAGTSSEGKKEENTDEQQNLYWRDKLNKYRKEQEVKKAKDDFLKWQEARKQYSENGPIFLGTCGDNEPTGLDTGRS